MPGIFSFLAPFGTAAGQAAAAGLQGQITGQQRANEMNVQMLELLRQRYLDEQQRILQASQLQTAAAERAHLGVETEKGTYELGLEKQARPNAFSVLHQFDPKTYANYDESYPYERDLSLFGPNIAQRQQLTKTRGDIWQLMLANPDKYGKITAGIKAAGMDPTNVDLEKALDTSDKESLERLRGGYEIAAAQAKPYMPSPYGVIGPDGTIQMGSVSGVTGQFKPTPGAIPLNSPLGPQSGAGSAVDLMTSGLQGVTGAANTMIQKNMKPTLAQAQYANVDPTQKAGVTDLTGQVYQRVMSGGADDPTVQQLRTLQNNGNTFVQGYQQFLGRELTPDERAQFVPSWQDIYNQPELARKVNNMVRAQADVYRRASAYGSRPQLQYTGGVWTPPSAGAQQKTTNSKWGVSSP